MTAAKEQTIIKAAKMGIDAIMGVLQNNRLLPQDILCTIKKMAEIHVMTILHMTGTAEDEKMAEEEKQRLFDFVKNDIMPLVAQQSGEDSERYRLAKMAYFVLHNRTVENRGCHD